MANTEYNGIKFFAQETEPEVTIDESKRVINQTTFTQGETYFVTDSDDLVKLQDLVNSGVDTTDVTFELTSNIDMKGINFRGIGTAGGDEQDLVFKGDFKGNNHVISNLTINTTEDYVGLFGAVLGGSIDSVGLENCEVSGGWYVGGLAGAIVGGSITNSYATASVTGTSLVGGLVGAGNATITNCYATGSVTGYNYVGGLAGAIEGGSITNSYATASVTGDEFVGGLVGFCSGSSITNSYATGSVTGTGSSVGGLVGAAYAIPTLNGYYDTQKTGQTVGVGNGSYTGTVTGVTTAELEELIKNGTLPQYNYGGGTGGGTGGGVFGGSYEVTLQVGIHSDKSSSITVDVGIGKIDLNIDVTTPDGARNALTTLDEYLKSINEKQTELGSAYNRLESVIESIGVSIDNLTSTRSTIQDADIAEESSAYIRNQILQQASATLLATANQTPSIALQLL